MQLLVLALCMFALAVPVHADTRRVAVVVGNNAGNGEQAPLRYAEIDAGKMGRVLVELGGVERDDMFLLQGQDLATLEATLERAKARVKSYQQSGLDRVVLLFYYSGHSDGVALELGRDRFTFVALRRWLKDTGADVRVAFIDACKSGALLATKGGTPGPAFQIRLSDDLASTGEALLTSSAADENALESKEIGGSFFTHHLVSGLRGAADTSGDARVTLTEAYQYAYKHTIATSGATLAGTQHPAYDYRLSGQGELTLTELARPSAALALPEGFDRALVIELARDQVIAELGRGAPAHIAVVPGRYGIRAWKQNRVFEGRIVVAASSIRAVRWDELQSAAIPTTRAKGDAAVSARAEDAVQRRHTIEVSAGGRAAIATQLDALAGGRIAVRPAGARGWSVAGEATTMSETDVRETSAFVVGGYHVGIERGRLGVFAGIELGGGAVFQTAGATFASAAVAVAPVVRASVALTPGVGLALNGDARSVLLRKDGKLALELLPALWLGITVTR